MRYCRVCSTSVLRIVNFSSLRYVRNGGKVCTTSTKIWKNGYQAGSDRWLWSVLVDPKILKPLYLDLSYQKLELIILLCI